MHVRMYVLGSPLTCPCAEKRMCSLLLKLHYPTSPEHHLHVPCWLLVEEHGIPAAKETSSSLVALMAGLCSLEIQGHRPRQVPEHHRVCFTLLLTYLCTKKSSKVCLSTPCPTGLSPRVGSGLLQYSFCALFNAFCLP